MENNNHNENAFELIAGCDMSRKSHESALLMCDKCSGKANRKDLINYRIYKRHILQEPSLKQGVGILTVPFSPEAEKVR